MKDLNKFIKLPKLSMFTYPKAYQNLLASKFACTIDLSNAFWHIGIHPDCKRYLAFNFDRTNYWWTAMPFGLRTAPYLFCKLIGTLIKHIVTTYDILVYFYMDDLIILAPSLEIAHKHLKIVIEEIQKAGLKINFEKSELVPKSNVIFLGVEIDLAAKSLVPSTKNIASCVSKSLHFCNGQPKLLKHFQSLIGSLNFVASYIKQGKLNLSPLHKFMPFFSNEVSRHVPAELGELLSFWSSPSSYIPVPIPNLVRNEVKIHCDASQVGWGAFISWPDGSHSSLQGSWDECWSSEHINLKELTAALFALQYHSDKMENHLIIFFSDNKAAVTWISKGSSTRSAKAREILRSFEEYKYKHNLDFKAFYIKGKDNVLADSLSRSLDSFSELELKTDSFTKLCNLTLCSPDVDLFANYKNHKCPTYFSSISDPLSAGTNAFSQDWNKFRCLYAFPPSHLINRVLYKFLNSSCNKLLIIVPRSHQRWHSNIKKLTPFLVPHMLTRDNFSNFKTTPTQDSVQDPYLMTAYLLSHH